MINFSGFIKKDKGMAALPSKKGINLYVRETDGNSAQVVLPLAIFLAVMILAIYRLGVVDRLARLAELQSQNAALKSQLESINAKVSTYEDILEEYRRLTTSYLAENEKGIVKRERVFEMIDECTDGIGTVNSISIEGNQVGVIVDIASLEDIDTIQDRLDGMDNINEIMLSTAKGTNNIEVQGYIIFTVKEMEDEENTALTTAGNLTDEERIARYEEYTSAIKEAREAEASGKSSAASIQRAESIYGGSAGAVENKVSSALAVSSSAGTAQTGAASQPQGGSSAAQSTGSGASVQTIGGDTVVIGSDPSQAPQGFSSLEEGMAALQGAGS